MKDGEENSLILLMLQPPKTDPLVAQSKILARKRRRANQRRYRTGVQQLVIEEAKATYIVTTPAIPSEHP